MPVKYHPIELKAEAIRLVIERRLSAAEAAQRLNLSRDAVATWVRRFRASKLHNAVRGRGAERFHTSPDEVARERDALVRLVSELLRKIS